MNNFLVASACVLGLAAAASSKIDTVVVLMMENRAFDHMLGFMSRGGPFGDERVDGLRGDECNAKSLADPDGECVATARSQQCLDPDLSDIDAVQCEPEGSIHYGSCYFFKGDQYFKWQETTGKAVPGYPKSMFASFAWPGIAAEPDAIMVPPKTGKHAGYYYFFKGSVYYKWDTKKWAAVSGYPRNISSGFPGIPNDLDAAHCEPEASPLFGNCYFFKGSQYWKWDEVNAEAVPGYPDNINAAHAWPGMPTNIDGIMVPPSTGTHKGYYYFFKGDIYYKWDAEKRQVVSGYPKKISAGFPGLGSSGIVCVNDKALDNCPYDPDHSHAATTERIFGCKYSSCTTPPCGANDSSPCANHASIDTPATMTGFTQSAIWKGNDGENELSMWPPEKVPVITTLAKQFANFDRFFSSHPGPTYPNRQFVHSGTAHGETDDGEIPTTGFPQKTIFRQVEEAGLDWKMYYEDSLSWAIFLADIRRDESKPRLQDMERFYEDAAAGTLPAYSFIEPRISPNHNCSRPSFCMTNTQHPAHSVREGERLMKDVYEALRNGPQWNSTLLIITYDEHGGFFDHVPPPQLGVPNPDGIATKGGFNYTRLGMRIPTIAISPWIEKNVLVHEPPASQKPEATSQWELSSIPSTVAKLLDLPGHPLTARTAWAATFEHLLSRDAPRMDCPTSLPEVPPPTAAERARQMAMPINEHARGVVKMLCDMTEDASSDATAIDEASCDALGICLPRRCGEGVHTQADFAEWSSKRFLHFRDSGTGLGARRFLRGA